MSEERTPGRLRLTAIVELLLPLILLMMGTWLLFRVEKPSEWPGLILIALSIFAYMARGQIITTMALNKDGFTAKLQAKAQEALNRADAAQQKAELATQVVRQYAVTEMPSSEVAREADPWDHPTLERETAPADDMQKNQWGGAATRNGRRLSATVTPADKNWFEIRMRVESTDPARPLIEKVRFHLHQSFGRRVVTVSPKDGVAELERVAYGAFTVGAEVEGEPETYLELDMSADKFDAPIRFKKR